MKALMLTLYQVLQIILIMVQWLVELLQDFFLTRQMVNIFNFAFNIPKICDFFSVLQLSNPLLLGLNALICGTLLIPAVPMMYIYNWMLR